MKPKQRLALFERFAKENPRPQTELLYTSTFELMVAVMLSAQSTDKKVNEVTRILFAKANTPESMLLLGETAIKAIIRPVNYYVTKTKHLLQTCHFLIERHLGQVPSTRKDLEALPGIGRKTANVILNVAFDQPTIAVDTHIFRVANRTGLAPGKTPLEVEQKLKKVIPRPFLLQAHHWLVLHGRYTCLARKPLCQGCIIRDLCEYPDKT